MQDYNLSLTVAFAVIVPELPTRTTVPAQLIFLALYSFAHYRTQQVLHSHTVMLKHVSNAPVVSEDVQAVTCYLADDTTIQLHDKCLANHV